MPDYEGIVAGVVLSVEPVPGKDKLKALTVDIGKSDPVAIVTNAGNVNEGNRVVVATVGATVKVDGDEIEVKKANVGGAPSEGMLCDCPMLGWSGGGAGAAALLPPSFNPGDTPPSSRPRMDGKGPDAEEPKGKEPEPLFAKKEKLSKEEKKAAAAAKKAAREAKKAEKSAGAADDADPDE